MTIPTNISPLMRRAQEEQLEVATLGTGCFWCTEAIFQKLKGVKEVVPGYAGGHVEQPSYEEVCGKQTGHAEAIQILFDSTDISYASLLEVFWQVHDPTTLNRQGNDVGPQYRSAIFYHTPEQQEAALLTKAKIEGAELYPDLIVTEITAFTNFYVAEDYHHNYFNKVGGRNPYCQVVVRPKVEKFMRHFSDRLQAE